MSFKTLAAIEAVIILSLLGYIYLTNNKAPLVAVDNQTVIQPQPQKLAPKPTNQTNSSSNSNTKPNEPLLTTEADKKPIAPAKESFDTLLDNLISMQGDTNIESLLVSKGEELFDMLNTNPELANKIIERFGSLSDPKVEEFLAQLIVMSGIENIEETMMQKVSSSNTTESRKWLRILSYAGATTANNRQAVMQQMRSLDAQGINLAIKSLVPINAYSSERKTITNELKAYLQHNDEQVRVQALKALGRWAGEERQQIIEKGLSDSSAIMRSTAMLTAYEANIKSNKIKQQLFKIMRDESQKSDDRLIASTALEEYNLSDAERDNHTQFTRTIETLFEQEMQD